MGAVEQRSAQWGSFPVSDTGRPDLFGLPAVARYPWDLFEWLRYMKLAREDGILAAYPDAVDALRADYPPLSFVGLGLLARFAGSFLHQRFYCAQAITDAADTRLCRGGWRLAERWRPLVAVAMFLTLVLDAMLEVYIDVYFVFFLLLAIYCFIRGRSSSGAALFAVSCLSNGNRSFSRL